MVGGRPQAQYTTLSNGSVRVRHREFVGNISTSNKSWNDIDNLAAFPLQPGDGTAFPWLSQMAANYEKWTANKINFTYEPFVATSTTGAVSLFIDYDANDSAPSNKAEMLNSEGAKRTPVWSNVTVQSKREYLNPTSKMYVRVPTRDSFDGNLRLTDIGTCFVAVTDADRSGGDFDVGEIWVDYDITLHIPAFHKAEPMSGRSLTVGNTEDDILGEGGTRDGDKGAAVTYSTTTSTSGVGSVFTFLQDFVGIVRLAVGEASDTSPAPVMKVTTSEINGRAPVLIGNVSTNYDNVSETSFMEFEVVASSGEACRIVSASPAPAPWSLGDLLIKCLPYAKVLMGVLLGAVTREEKYILAIKHGLPANRNLTHQQLKQMAATVSKIGYADPSEDGPKLRIATDITPSLKEALPAGSNPHIVRDIILDMRASGEL